MFQCLRPYQLAEGNDRYLRAVQKHSVSKSSAANITPPASLIAVCKRYVSGVEDCQDWNFGRIVSPFKEGSSRVAALNNQIVKRSRQNNTKNKVDYQEPGFGFSQQSLSLITPQKLPPTPERPRKPAPGRSETSEARSIRQSKDPTISNLRTQTTYLEQSILQLQESYDQLQVRRHILELESELYMTRLLYNHHFGLQIAEDEALKYSVKICNRIQPDASLVDFRRPKCAPIQLGDDFDDAGLRLVQHYTPQYLYVIVHDLPADIEDGIEVEMARKKAEVHLLWLGTRVQNIMASGNHPAIAVMTAYMNDIISYLPPRWSDTIRKNVWINVQLHITTRNTIPSTCWDLLEWLAFAWFVSHGHTDLEGQLISSTTKNPNRRQCLHQLIRSLKTIHAGDFIGLLQHPDIHTFCAKWEGDSSLINLNEGSSKMAILGTTPADGAMHASEYIWVKTGGIVYFSTRGFEIRVEWNESASAVCPVVRPINQAELPWFKVLGKEKISYFGRYYTAAATMRLICKTMLGEYLSKETAELNVRSPIFTC